jgi:hypothetical protein
VVLVIPARAQAEPECASGVRCVQVGMDDVQVSVLDAARLGVCSGSNCADNIRVLLCESEQAALNRRPPCLPMPGRIFWGEHGLRRAFSADGAALLYAVSRTRPTRSLRYWWSELD